MHVSDKCSRNMCSVNGKMEESEGQKKKNVEGEGGGISCYGQGISPGCSHFHSCDVT